MDLTISKETALATLKKGFAKAEEFLKDDEKIKDLLLRIEEKLKMVPRIGEQLSHIPVFISMIRSYVKKEYTKAPVGTIVAIISAIAYFLSPVDVIPDGIPVAGYVDDAAIITACLSIVDSDIKEYILWRDSKEE